MVYYIVEEVLEIMKVKWAYFSGFWNNLDIVVILLCVLNITLNLYTSFVVQSQLKTLLGTQSSSYNSSKTECKSNKSNENKCYEPVHFREAGRICRFQRPRLLVHAVQEWSRHLRVLLLGQALQVHLLQQGLKQ